MIWHLEYDWYIKYLPNLILILALCNGNDTCCTSSNQCDIGEGDCDKDEHCKGDLICGKDNCLVETNPKDGWHNFGFEGPDDTKNPDDCCTEKITFQKT